MDGLLIIEPRIDHLRSPLESHKVEDLHKTDFDSPPGIRTVKSDDLDQHMK